MYKTSSRQGESLFPRQLLRTLMNEPNSLCNKQGIRCLGDKKDQVLWENCIIMNLLTATYDIIRGDNCSFGILLMILEVAVSRTLVLKDTLKEDSWPSMCHPLHLREFLRLSKI